MTVSASKDWVQQLYVQEINKKSPEPDFYKDKFGNVVMTESYHIKRGKCCGSGNGCKHCPFDPIHTKGTTKIREKPKEW